MYYYQKDNGTIFRLNDRRVTEEWDGKAWIFNPRLMAYLMGDDLGFSPIADPGDLTIQVTQIGTSSSGNRGHAGRKGEVGGSVEGTGGGKEPKVKRIPKMKGGKGTEAETAHMNQEKYGIRLKGFPPSQEARIKEGIPQNIKDRTHDDPVGDLKDLAAGKVPTPDGVDMSSIPTNQNELAGFCYMYALKMQMDNPDWNVVHETLYPRNGPFQDQVYFHAVTEKGDTVFDPVFKEFYQKSVYDHYMEPTDRQVYTHDEAMKAAIKSGNYGPWK